MTSKVLIPCLAVVHNFFTMPMMTNHAFQASPTSSVAPKNPNASAAGMRIKRDGTGSQVGRSGIQVRASLPPGAGSFLNFVAGFLNFSFGSFLNFVASLVRPPLRQIIRPPPAAALVVASGVHRMVRSRSWSFPATGPPALAAAAAKAAVRFSVPPGYLGRKTFQMSACNL